MVCRRHIDVLACVELKGWLSAEDLQVETSFRMGKGDYLLKTAAPGIEGNFRVRRIHNEAVIDVGLLSTQDECLVRLDSRKVADRSRGNICIVHFLKFGCTQSTFCAFNRGSVAESEVTADDQ